MLYSIELFNFDINNSYMITLINFRLLCCGVKRFKCTYQLKYKEDYLNYITDLLTNHWIDRNYSIEITEFFIVPYSMLGIMKDFFPALNSISLSASSLPEVLVEDDLAGYQTIYIYLDCFLPRDNKLKLTSDLLRDKVRLIEAKS